MHPTNMSDHDILKHKQKMKEAQEASKNLPANSSENVFKDHSILPGGPASWLPNPDVKVPKQEYDPYAHLKEPVPCLKDSVGQSYAKDIRGDDDDTKNETKKIVNESADIATIGKAVQKTLAIIKAKLSKTKEPNALTYFDTLDAMDDGAHVSDFEIEVRPGKWMTYVDFHKKLGLDGKVDVTRALYRKINNE